MAALSVIFFNACENRDIEFPDFDYSAVYFAYQYPVRTIVLGEDTYDTSLDNEHKCLIYATMGGVYDNDKRIVIDFEVDNSLCDNLYFLENEKVVSMPSDYYSLAENKIVLDKTLRSAVEVQLTEHFFNDEKSLSNTYVIPLRMKQVENADSILSGRSLVESPIYTNASDWDVLPKNYILYCIKYINQWHANYLRRGVDVVSKNGQTETQVRRKEYVENDEVCKLTTTTLQSVHFPVSVVGQSGNNEVCTLLLSFSDDESCSVSSATEGFAAKGSGRFVKKGEKESWGNEDRDALYLDYTIETGNIKYATKDTLVIRDRGVKMETFNPIYKVQ